MLSFLDPQDLRKLSLTSKKVCKALQDTPEFKMLDQISPMIIPEEILNQFDLSIENAKIKQENHSGQELDVYTYKTNDSATIKGVFVNNLDADDYCFYTGHYRTENGHERGPLNTWPSPDTTHLYHYIKNSGKTYVPLNNEVASALKKLDVRGDFDAITLDGGFFMPNETYTAPKQLKSIVIQSSHPETAITFLKKNVVDKGDEVFDRNRSVPNSYQNENGTITDFIRTCPSLQKVTVPFDTLSSNDLEHLKSQGWDTKVQDGHFSMKKRPIQHQAEESKE